LERSRQFVYQPLKPEPKKTRRRRRRRMAWGGGFL